MAEILHHLGCMKHYKWWDIYHINWCRISAINSSIWKVGGWKTFSFPFGIAFRQSAAPRQHHPGNQETPSAPDEFLRRSKFLRIWNRNHQRVHLRYIWLNLYGKSVPETIETNIYSPWKIDGWKTFCFPFGFSLFFSGELWVLVRVSSRLVGYN